LYLIWRFLCKTIFSLTWWKEHWYLPWLFIAGIVGWVISGGRGSALSLIKRTTEIRKEERNNVIDIRRHHIEEEAKIERESNLKKEAVRTKAVARLEAEKTRLRKQQELLKGNSEAINKDLNDVLND